MSLSAGAALFVVLALHLGCRCRKMLMSCPCLDGNDSFL